MLPSCITFFFHPNYKSLFSKNQSLVEKYFQISIYKIKQVFGNITILNNYFKNSKESIFIDQEIEVDFLREILNFLPKSKLNDPDIDEIFFAYFDGLCPVLSPSLTKELQNRHYKYLSQYSYSENLPNGIVPRFLSREFVLTLPDVLEMPTHDFLFKNINEYDVEIFYQSPDLRYYRLDFSGTDKRSLFLIRDFLNFKQDCEYKEIPAILSNNLHFLRKSPSYIELEVSRKCKLESTFSPRKFLRLENEGFLEPNIFKKTILQLDSEFQSEYTVSFAGLGEPFENPNLLELIRIALSGRYVKELIIETFLYHPLEKILSYIGQLDGVYRDKITFIVNLSTLKKETYKKLYQRDFFEQVYQNLEKLATSISKSQIYLQFMKIMELEEELDEYYQKVESLGYGIILQKYNSYCELMPEKRAADLTPLQREFCWHLNRDMYINFDGSVALCKQVPTKIIGDLTQEDLKEIWEKNNHSFELSFHKKDDLIDAPCKKCDEWYTFNA